MNRAPSFFQNGRPDYRKVHMLQRVILLLCLCAVVVHGSTFRVWDDRQCGYMVSVSGSPEDEVQNAMIAACLNASFTDPHYYNFIFNEGNCDYVYSSHHVGICQFNAVAYNSRWFNASTCNKFFVHNASRVLEAYWDASWREAQAAGRRAGDYTLLVIGCVFAAIAVVLLLTSYCLRRQEDLRKERKDNAQPLLVEDVENEQSDTDDTAVELAEV